MGASSGAPIKKGEQHFAGEADVPEVSDKFTPRETDTLLPPKEDDQSSPLGPIGFVLDLSNRFGWKHLVLLFVSQFLNKSFVHSLVDGGTPWLMKAYHIPAQDMQIYGGISQLPWSMKPIFGLTSDLFPIGGYKKAPYMLITTCLGFCCLLWIGTSSEHGLPIHILVACLFGVQVHIAFADLLTESKFAQKMREQPAKGPSLMTFVWGGMMVAGLFATVLNGSILETNGPNVLFLIACVPAAVLLIPALGNYFEESPISRSQASEMRAAFVAQEKEVAFLCVWMFAGGVSLILIPIFSPAEHRVLFSAIASLVVAASMILSFAVLLSPAIAKFNTFSLLQTSLSWSKGAAAFYFFTDSKEQFPGGPHFTPFFFNSIMGSWGMLFSLVGLYTYHRYFSNWSYRNLLFFAQVALAFTSLNDLVMFTRFNLTLGIPDKWMLIFSSMTSQVLWQWEWMPQVVIFSQLCPKGMEATMYALLAGAHNLGGVVSANCGALLLKYLECTPEGAINETAKFDNLWKASVVGTLLPLMTILLLFWLIPDVRQTEKILCDSDTATSGSVWQRWRGDQLP